MRYDTDIKLEDLIIHTLGSPAGLKLSWRPLPLEIEREVEAYVAEHLAKALQDPLAKAASFVSRDLGDVAQSCFAMTGSKDAFVAHSQKLAERLHQIIVADNRIKSGNLLICRYHARDRDNDVRRLGLLKLDLSRVFRPTVATDAAGTEYVTFAPAGDTLPTSRERLQKCAFIRTDGPQRDHDMLLLDRQTSPSEDRAVARYFIERFLGAELRFDARQRTHGLYIALISASNVLRNRLSMRDDVYLSDAIRELITRTQVDLDAWLASLDLPAEIVDALSQEVAPKLPDRVFDVDVKYAEEKLVPMRRFQGEFDLRVSVRADRYQAMFTVRPPDKAAGEEYFEVVIRTKHWDGVPQ